MEEKSLEKVLFVFLVIFTVVLRLSVLNMGGFLNYNDFYHLSIVKNAIASKSLPDKTSFDICYSDMPSSQPIDFYILPYIFSVLGISIETSFMIASLLAACLTLVLFYFFLKKIFGFKTAIISSFLLSATLAYFSRSNIFYYRGENLIYPLLLASILLCISMFKSESKNKFIFAVSAGAISALPAFIWTGYPFVLVSIFIALFLVLATNFIEMKETKKDIFTIALLIAVQFIILKIIVMITHLEHAFTKYSFYIYPGILLCLGLFYAARKINSSKGRLISLSILL